MEENMKAVVATEARDNDGLICPLENAKSFESAWRMATCLSRSRIVPAVFQGEQGVPNSMIALELASRLKTSIFMIMQNLYVVNGRPAFSAQFIIAAIQSFGRFSALKYKKRYDDRGNLIGCRAYATEVSSGDILEGPEITLEMARAEGWSTRNGSKWKTMPELMMTYRAAAFFGRLYAPDVMMGMHQEDEIIDATGYSPTVEPIPKNQDKTSELNALLNEQPKEAVKAEPAEVVDETVQSVAQDEEPILTNEVEA